MTGQDIDIAGPDGTFTGYLALPPGGRGPGVVVIQEVFGVNTPLRQITDEAGAVRRRELAELGGGGFAHGRRR